MILNFDLTDISFVVVWAVIFVITLWLEIQSFNLTTIWFCISAFVSLILAAFQVLPIIQIIVFVVLSTGLLLATKPLVKKLKEKPIIRTNVDQIIGQVAVVTKEISLKEYGEVKINNNLWRAVTKDDFVYQIGDEVIINEISGVKVIVSKNKIKKESKDV